ncbi:MAG: peroxiredoxin-like family protein [Flammeovirgaceae bacterium]
MKNLIVTLLLSGMSIILYSQTEIAATPTDIAPLLIGEKIPDISLLDVTGKSVKILDLAAQKPSVVIFYRGGWCPYCNVHLAQLQQIEADIIKAGYQILAISPDSPENLAATISKNDLKYTMLSDHQSVAIKGFGLAFRAPNNYEAMLQKASGGSNLNVLPVPAVFIINQQGNVIFEYINPDYKSRLKGSLLLAVLNELK